MVHAVDGHVAVIATGNVGEAHEVERLEVAVDDAVHILISPGLMSGRTRMRDAVRLNPCRIAGVVDRLAGGIVVDIGLAFRILAERDERAVAQQRPALDAVSRVCVSRVEVAQVRRAVAVEGGCRGRHSVPGGKEVQAVACGHHGPEARDQVFGRMRHALAVEVHELHAVSDLRAVGLLEELHDGCVALVDQKDRVAVVVYRRNALRCHVSVSTIRIVVGGRGIGAAGIGIHARRTHGLVGHVRAGALARGVGRLLVEHGHDFAIAVHQVVRHLVGHVAVRAPHGVERDVAGGHQELVTHLDEEVVGRSVSAAAIGSTRRVPHRPQRCREERHAGQMRLVRAVQVGTREVVVPSRDLVGVDDGLAALLVGGHGGEHAVMAAIRPAQEGVARAGEVRTQREDAFRRMIILHGIAHSMLVEVPQPRVVDDLDGFDRLVIQVQHQAAVSHDVARVLRLVRNGSNGHGIDVLVTGEQGVIGERARFRALNARIDRRRIGVTGLAHVHAHARR